MPFGRDEARHREAVTKHLRDVHTCPRCGKQIRGNGYGNHRRVCQTKNAPAVEQRATAVVGQQKEG